jgi:hypothetical protein
MIRITEHLWYIALFAAALLCCFLFSYAYPYGMIQSDTDSYLSLYQGFHWWSANENDWARTIPFAMLLGFVTHFSQPTVVVYWIHSLLFSIGIVCAAWMMAGLFHSDRKGVLFGCVLLLCEVLSMHAFAYNIFLLSDPMYAHMLLIGSTLILGGWMRGIITPIAVGYAVLGLAIFTRPVGLSLLPVWILFAICLWITARRTQALHFQTKHLALCIALLISPIVLWAARNAVVYGYFRETAFGSRNLLPHVLSLVHDDDVLIENAAENKTFITHIHDFGAVFGTDEDTYRWAGDSRSGNIFTLLADFLPVDPQVATLTPTEKYVRDAFRVDTFGTQIALRIIARHPLQYAALVFYHYRILLQPQTFPLRGDTGDWYTQQIQDQPIANRLLYCPPAGTINVSRISPTMTTVVQSIVGGNFLELLRIEAGFAMKYILHGLLFCCLFFVWKRPTVLQTCLPFSLFYASVITIMLIVTALSNYLLTAMTEAAVDRYALPGETGLHIALLLALLVAFSAFRQSLRSEHMRRG